MNPPLRQCLRAGMLGPAPLLIFGTGAAGVEEQPPALGHGGVAAFGLVVFLLLQSLGETSGADLNPAVTVGFWGAGRFAGRRVLPYVAAQRLGAALGSALVKLVAFRTWGPRGRPTGRGRPAVPRRGW